MTPWWMLARGALLFGAVWCALPLLRRAPAAQKRALLIVTFAMGLVGPLATWLLPAPTVETPLALRIERAPFAEPALPASPDVAPAPAPAHQEATLALEDVLLALWLCGSALALLRVTLSQHKAAALVRRATPHGAGIALSDELDTPAVVGSVRPRILLPRSALDWPEAQREAALAHERAHLARHDGLALLLAQLVTALYWMVPFAWLLARRLRRECELSADEHVVAGGLSPISYADTLLAVAERKLAPHPAVSFSLVSELEERIRALCAGPRRPWSALQKGGAFSLVIGLGLLLACAREVLPTQALAEAAGTGTDARLSRIVDEEAARTRKEWDANELIVVVLDARTGVVLSRLGGVDQPRVPGSTLKTFTVATALEAGKVNTSQRFDILGGKRPYGAQVLEDATPETSLDLGEVLMVSSNVGASRVYDALGGEALLRGFARLHLGDRGGARPSRLVDGSFEGAVVASGEGIRMTPLELTAAYRSLVDGKYRKPSFTPKGESPEDVFSARTVEQVRAMLERVVHDPRGTGGAAALAGVRVAGKTGTANVYEGKSELRYASFVGLVPAEAPRFVIHVGVSTARREATGGKAAAPLFARIAARALAP